MTSLQESLSSADLSLRQTVIWSASGINMLQSLKTSGVQARCCSGVPCATDGAGEAIRDSRPSSKHRCANGLPRCCSPMSRLSMLIGESLRSVVEFDALRHHDRSQEYTVAGPCACTDASRLGATVQ
jgi:hypothetical protein